MAGIVTSESRDAGGRFLRASHVVTGGGRHVGRTRVEAAGSYRPEDAVASGVRHDRGGRPPGSIGITGASPYEQRRRARHRLGREPHPGRHLRVRQFCHHPRRRRAERRRQQEPHAACAVHHHLRCKLDQRRGNRRDHRRLRGHPRLQHAYHLRHGGHHRARLQRLLHLGKQWRLGWRHRDQGGTAGAALLGRAQRCGRERLCGYRLRHRRARWFRGRTLRLAAAPGRTRDRH